MIYPSSLWFFFLSIDLPLHLLCPPSISPSFQPFLFYSAIGPSIFPLQSSTCSHFLPSFHPASQGNIHWLLACTRYWGYRIGEEGLFFLRLLLWWVFRHLISTHGNTMEELEQKSVPGTVRTQESECVQSTWRKNFREEVTCSLVPDLLPLAPSCRIQFQIFAKQQLE